MFRIEVNMISIIDCLINNKEMEPNKIIFNDKNLSVSNVEFYNNASHIASGLLNYNNQPIAIFMEKGVNLITAMMGVTLSGNFYTVIDSKMPLERIKLILDVLHPKKIITNLPNEFDNSLDYAELCESDINQNALMNVQRNIVDTNPMYVLFTSGSTGIPKGVVVSHKAVMAYLNWFTTEFSINNKTIFGNQTPLYFSMSISDVLGTIYANACLYFIPKMYFSFPIKLLDYLNEMQINTLYWVPSALSILANLDALNDYELPYLKLIMFAGEVMPTKVLNYFMDHVKGEYANLFGPTETTDICTFYRISKKIPVEMSIPIGKPCQNCGVLIVNGNEEVKIGEVGELYAKGSFLADGYYNNVEKTKEAFIQNPVNSAYPEIVYKTGDLVKMGTDGNLIYISRKDFQIKHMGYRIELGEIENRIYTIQNVIVCCCIYDKKNAKIVLFYVGEIDINTLNKAIALKLPDYMQPKRIVKIPKMIYNINGKKDRVYFNNLAEGDK